MTGDERLTMSGPITGYPNGSCQKHGIPLINKDGRPHCLRCASDAAKLEIRNVEVNTLPDPGHEGMRSIVPVVAKADDTQQVPSAVKMVAPTALTPLVNFREHMATAIAHLKKAPMPKDISQFKAVQKAINLLEKMTGEIH